MVPRILGFFLAAQCLFVVVSASEYANSTLRLRQIMPTNWALALAKRQVTTAEPCVQFETQVPCDFESCCPAGMLCSVDPGGASFLCVPASAISCPTNTVQCTDGSGCCPVGTTCTGNGHCNVDCTSADPVCGTGCCPTRFGIECDQSTLQCVESSGSTSLLLDPTAGASSTRAATTSRGSSATASAGVSSSTQKSGAVDTLVSLIYTSIALLIVTSAV